MQPVDQSQKRAVSLETYEIRILQLVAGEVTRPGTPAKSLSQTRKSKSIPDVQFQLMGALSLARFGESISLR